MTQPKVQDANSLPWDPENEVFPTRKELPKFEGKPSEAAWVWGEDDGLGRLNLLTSARVKAAAAEIKTGEMACLDLPTNIPAQTMFGRVPFEHTIHVIEGGLMHDDSYKYNTQGSTQWDGFRHCSHFPSASFFNNTKAEDITGPNANLKASIHLWSEHGFAGRGVLLDYKEYAEHIGKVYDSADPVPITYDDLVACGKFQGMDIRPASQGGDIKVGDILMIRTGFVQDYHRRTPEEHTALANRDHAMDNNEQTWAGVKQEQPILDWLHDCYFSAVGGDSPGFEMVPFLEGFLLHWYILGLWGMPLGELIDLEGTSKLAKKNKRYTFFFTSNPSRCPGGIASGVHGTAFF